MDRDDIIRMAREASFVWEDLGLLDRLAFYKFADLVAAAEREACAKLAEETVCVTHLPTGVKIYGSRVAAAIRARSNK